MVAKKENFGRSCETCSLICTRRVPGIEYDVDAAIAGGLGDALHQCYYLRMTGFNVDDILVEGTREFAKAMAKFYKAEILRCVENGNVDGLANYEQLLMNLLLKNKKLLEHSAEADDPTSIKHQNALEELFPKVNIVKDIE